MSETMQTEVVRTASQLMQDVETEARAVHEVVYEDSEVVVYADESMTELRLLAAEVDVDSQVLSEIMHERAAEYVDIDWSGADPVVVVKAA